MKKLLPLALLSTLAVCVLCAACNNSRTPSSTNTGTEDSFSNKNDRLTQERLRRFDSLDFQFYSNQKWDSFAISHAADIKVYYPDGTTTTGLFPQHINMLTPLFAFAPDTKIFEHPVKFGTGDWTTVIGTMEGTFSKPMDLGNGKSIPPTNKKFRLSMCTVGHWKGDKMIEEYLFWDNQAMMKQIGLAQ
ncbi:MAG TPA: ester cyclase [Flavisolibacter sp.]|nr:ester cyclase [Flavisolibacter sp.]